MNGRKPRMTTTAAGMDQSKYCLVSCRAFRSAYKYCTKYYTVLEDLVRSFGSLPVCENTALTGRKRELDAGDDPPAHAARIGGEGTVDTRRHQAPRVEEELEREHDETT